MRSGKLALGGVMTALAVALLLLTAAPVATIALAALAGLTGRLTLPLLGARLAGSVAVGLVFVGIDAAAKVIWHRPGIGLGDTLMVAILAWWLTGTQLLVMFLLAFWLGALVGVVLLLARRSHCQVTVAFLPFINLAFLLAYFWGAPLAAALFGG